MATETQSAPAAPELTILNRVVSIPLVGESLAAVHTTLTNNAYTRTPYTTAQAISSSVLQHSQPIAARLAPLITRADGLASQGFDAVETRFPYPFHTPADQMIKDFKSQSDAVVAETNKTIDERVKSPALAVAQSIDQVRSLILPVLSHTPVACHTIPYREYNTDHPSPFRSLRLLLS